MFELEIRNGYRVDKLLAYMAEASPGQSLAKQALLSFRIEFLILKVVSTKAVKNPP